MSICAIYSFLKLSSLCFQTWSWFSYHTHPEAACRAHPGSPVSFFFSLPEYPWVRKVGLFWIPCLLTSVRSFLCLITMLSKMCPKTSYTREGSVPALDAMKWKLWGWGPEISVLKFPNGSAVLKFWTRFTGTCYEMPETWDSKQGRDLSAVTIP